MEKEGHKKLGIELFNLTWDLMDKADRTQSETDRMIHAAHASCYHWEIAGTALNLARGEWQISRVYAVLDRPEPCLYHAERCLQITLENEFKDFDLAFAYEAMARAYELIGDKVETAKYYTLAQDTGAEIKDSDNRDYFFRQLHTIRSDEI